MKNKIYYIAYWYKNDIEGHIHSDKEGKPIIFNNREAAFSYMGELKYKNPDYTFSVMSIKSEKELKDVQY